MPAKSLSPRKRGAGIQGWIGAQLAAWIPAFEAVDFL